MKVTTKTLSIVELKDGMDLILSWPLGYKSNYRANSYSLFLYLGQCMKDTVNTSLITVMKILRHG